LLFKNNGLKKRLQPVTLEWINQPNNRCVNPLRQQVLNSRGGNRLWLRFRNYITIFILFVDWVGQTYEYVSFLGGHVQLSPIHNIVFIIFVNYFLYIASMCVRRNFTRGAKWTFCLSF